MKKFSLSGGVARHGEFFLTKHRTSRTHGLISLLLLDRSLQAVQSIHGDISQEDTDRLTISWQFE